MRWNPAWLPCCRNGCSKTDANRFTTTNNAATPRLPSRLDSRSRVTTGYRVASYEPNALRKRFRKALIRQSGAPGPGCIPSTQPQPAIRRITAGSCAMTEIGTS